MPAAVYWVGGDPSYPNDTGDPANWSGGACPSMFDDVYFDSSAVVPDAVTPAGTSFTFKSLHLVNGYAGTFTLLSPVAVGDLELASGDIAQPGQSPGSTGVTLSVTASMSWMGATGTCVWTGGVLNSSADPATLSLGAGTVTTIDPQGGSLTTGDTLNFDNGGTTTGSTGTFNPGTVQFNNDADLNVYAFCSVAISPSAVASVLFQNPNPGNNPQINVYNGAMVTVNTGLFTSNKVPVNVIGGTLQILGTSHATFSGQVNGVAAAGSVQMSAGSIAIQHGATLEANDNGLKASGGRISTLAGNIAIVDKQAVESAANIIGNVEDSGADIVINDGSTSRLYTAPNGAGSGVFFGRLVIQGSLDWTGGTYRPVVYAPGNLVDQRDCDILDVSEALTMPNTDNGGSEKLDPGTTDANGNLNATPSPDGHWGVIVANTIPTIKCMLPTVPATSWARDYADNPLNPKTIFVETFR